MSTEEQKILEIKVKYEDAIYGIVKYKEKIAELEAAEKSLKEQYKKGKVTYNEYVTQVAAVGEVVKEYKENVRGLSKEVQNNIKVEREQQGSLRALRAELSNCVKEYDSLSKAERESSTGKAMADHINAISAELKEAEEKTSRFYRSVGSYENSIKNALGLNNKFADSLLAIGKQSNSIPGMLSSAGTAATAFAKALMGLMTNPIFLALAGVVGAGTAFKWFFDYNKGIEEATRLTKEFLGLTGNELKAMRSEIQATADTFGKDYIDVLKAVDNIVSQYGISAQEALKVVNDGFVAGADLSGNMLSQIERYSASFHDAGIGAQELVTILAQTRSGIFSEKGVDLIETASKKIREMSIATTSSLDAIGISSKQVEADLRTGAKSTFDVIREISAKLKTLPQDSREVGSVLKDVFGKQGASGGLKMIESLSTMSTKIEDVKAVTGEYGKEQEKQLKATAELNATMSALFDMSEKGFGEMLLKLKTMAAEGLTAVLKGLVKIINYLVDVYNNSLLVRGGFESVSASVKTMWNVAKLVFNFLIDQVKGVARAFKGLAGIIEGVLSFDIDKMKQGFEGVMQAIGKTSKEMLADFGDFGKQSAKAYVDAFNNTIKGTKVGHLAIPENAGNGAQSASNILGGKLVGALENNGLGGKSKGNSADIARKELDEVRKAEDLLTKLVEDSYEKRRQIVVQKYDRQIADIQQRLQSEKNLTVNAKAAMNEQLKSLELLKGQELEELSDAEMRRRVEAEQKRISLILTTVKNGSLEERDLKLKHLNNQEQLDIEQAKKDCQNEEERQQMILAILRNYDQQREDLEKEFYNRQIRDAEEQIRKEYAARIAVEDEEMEKLRLRVEEKRALRDAAQQLEGESQEEWVIRQGHLNDDVAQSEKALSELEKTEAEKRQKFKLAELEAAGKVTDGLTSLFEALGESNSELTALSKMLALANIAISTGEAISKGVAASAGVPYPGNLIAIATTVGTVLANMASAIKIVKSMDEAKTAKYATGGDVIGSGTGTSDSVPAMLSNGESVMTAKATQMFAPVLSAFNQIGGGVPITAGNNPQTVVLDNGGFEDGMQIIAKAVAEGMKQAPRPVVSVEEINRVNNRLNKINQISVLE